MSAYKDNWNKKKYDQTLVRFPSGTLARFKELFPDASFNGWVVSLVCSRLLLKELYFPTKQLPYPDEPPKEGDEIA